jgi:toxin CcdB
MPQFDVLRMRGSGVYSLVVDIQADVHERLGTRIVVPLVTRARYTRPTTRLTPGVKIRDDDYVLLFPQMAAIPRASLGEVVDSLVAQRAMLLAAFDLLITGS